MNSPATQLTFTVDGQTIVVNEKHQTAASILHLAGLDPAGYDLAELRGQGDPHTFHDDQQIIVKDGDAFVSIRQNATVA